MKFSCESCQAQYMISDEKVGPSGVRVRCKKCQHINLIKPVSLSPPTDATPVPAPAPAATAPEPAGGASESPAPKGSNPGLDIPKDLEEEIGNALDSVFTESQIPAAEPAAEAAPAGQVSSGTQSGAPQQPAGPRTSGTQSGAQAAQPSATTSVVAAPPISAAAAEWFVAINDEQVGPLRAEDVKARWEKGEIGADTLVWCGRMPDWRPLSAVEDLARLVVPIRSHPTPLPRAMGSTPSAPLPNDGEPGIGFKPSAASAMASLASLAKEEISAADRSRKISQPVKAAGSATAGMLADLPAPTDQIPATPRAVPAPEDHHDEAPPARAPRLTRESYEASRSSGGGLKWAAVIAAVAVVSVGSAGAAYWFLVKPKLEEKRATHDEALVVRKETPPPAPPVPTPAAAATPTPPPTPPTPNIPPPPPPAKEVAAAKPPAHATPPKPPPPPPAEDRRHRRERGHAAEERPARVAAAGGSAAAGEDFLNGAGESSLDKEFAKELEGGGEGAAKPGAKPHSVYIPPPPGQGDLPQALTQSQIMETVVQHKGSFAKCVAEQKKRDASSTGTLVMRWKIRPDGHTADIVSKGGDYQDNSPLAACLRTQITRMKFGGYRGPQMAPIDFPFTF